MSPSDSSLRTQGTMPKKKQNDWKSKKRYKTPKKEGFQDSVHMDSQRLWQHV